MAETKPSFEEQLAELEKVVEQLERGDLALEDSVGLFERGMRLSEACKGQLASAESRIQVLLHPRERGEVRVEDLALESEADDEEV
ncbi:MAG TPA: exodeoxyribonuclease VII small subunit [Acidobacteriaceae bacterium]|nr:exodeoxyribonuclease VII small subunit [Acidobacteriaceae bacterium]